eukprot:848533-Pyramimonas_sp.AAC.1
MFEDHMLKAAELAALFLCRPSGGAAVQGPGLAGQTQDGGCAQVEASFDEMEPHWIEWYVPKSTLGALPFATSFSPFRFL